MQPPGRPIRWWPAIVLLALGLAAQLWLRLDGDRTGQERFFAGVLAWVATLLLLLLWFFFFSRISGRVRLLGLALLIALGVAARFTLRIEGVSGDVVPIFGWRWAAEAPGGAAPGIGAGRGSIEPTPRDYPRFLGPHGDATVDGVRLARDWEAQPPREVWRRPMGAGWSAFAVVGELAVTQEQRGDEELVTAYELATGEPVWTHSDPGRYESVIAGNGPRANPTIDGGQVFAVGARGRLNALDLATGRRLWSRDLLEENGAALPEWGLSASPLVLGERVIVIAGGAAGKSLVAYDRRSGEPLWSGGSDGAGYATPKLVTLAGTPQVVAFTQRSVVAHSPENGEVLWRFDWPAEQPNVAQPVPLPGDRLLVSSGYGIGSKLIQVSNAAGGGLDATLVWESPRLKAKFANFVVHDGSVYGLDDGIFVCLDPETGERRWKRGRYGHGQMILVGDLLLVQTEKGEVVLLEPNPEEHRELGRFSVLDGKAWNNPALVGPYLLVRNHEEAAMFELPLAST